MLTHVPDWASTVAPVVDRVHDEVTLGRERPNRGTIAAAPGQRYMVWDRRATVWRPAVARRQTDGLLGILEETTWP